jgi:ribosome-binding ATPase YchF (GTP1/OBG family)
VRAERTPLPSEPDRQLADLPGRPVFPVAEVESELLELDEESTRELLESIGRHEPGLHSLARAGFHTLGLQTYLTAGPKESRARTIPKGATARRRRAGCAWRSRTT